MLEILLLSLAVIFLALPLSYLLFKDTLFFGKLRNLSELIQLLICLKLHAKFKNGKVWSFSDEWEKIVDNAAGGEIGEGDVIQFICAEDGRQVSRVGLDRMANQIAHWGHDELGLQQKDTVALMMLNRPELVGFWLGMNKMGVSTALLNTNITGKPFMHSVMLSVKSSSNKLLVVDSELKDVIQNDVSVLTEEGIQILYWDDIEKRLDNFPATRPSSTWRNTVKESDPFLFIFTSGTTGLPKAGKISQTRFQMGSIVMHTFCYLAPGMQHRVYNCLPLYHSAGGMLGVGAVLRSGATMVLRKKFSVRAFSADVLKFHCTTVQYIGELCRYLVNSPPCEEDGKMKVLYAFGNGMRPDIWEKFQARYNVNRVVEFYASTEGNINLFNSTGRVGALGYIPPVLADLLYPVKILQVDEADKSKPLRYLTNSTSSSSTTATGAGEAEESTAAAGFCRVAAFGEVGLVVNVVNNKYVERRFDGYSDDTATNSKLIKDVLQVGDCYFNSGDLLSRNSEGFYFWSDRVGDTFRWKGENVATTEVAEVLAAMPRMFSDVTVYGVSVPHCDGKVGMAAVVLTVSPEGGAAAGAESSVDWPRFHQECVAHLPAYARPAFIRIRPAMQITSTFKHQKGDLVKAGYDLEKVGTDKVYFYSHRDGKISPLTPALLLKIDQGAMKL